MDVFKYLKGVNVELKEGAADDAREMGLEYAGYGKWRDPKTGAVTHKSLKSGGQTTLQKLDPKDQPQQQQPGAKPDEKKTLRQMRKDQQPRPRQDLVKKAVDKEEEAVYAAQAAAQGMWPHFSDERKQFHIQQQKQIAADQEEAERLEREEQEAKIEKERAKAEKDDAKAAEDLAKAAELEPEPRKDRDEFRTVDEVIESESDDPDDGDDDYLSNYEKTIADYKSRLGELTATQNKNVDKKFSALREAIGKIDNKDKAKAFDNALSLAYSYTGRVNSGAGKNALGKVDYELLEKNRKRLQDGYGSGKPEEIKEFVESTRPIDVSDEEVEVFFDALPPKLQQNFMKAGKISDSYEGHSLGIDKDGNQMRGKLSGKTNGVSNGRLRGLMVAKLFLQQGGKDGYTGADLDLNATDLEHVRGFNNKDDGDPTQEMKDQRENVDNFILTASNLNQTKVDKNMDEWYNTEVDRLKDFSDEDYQTRDTLTDQSNTVNNKAKLVNDLFFDGDNLSENATAELFDMYSNNDRQMAKTINKNINQFGKTKGIKLPNVKSRMGYEMIKKLGLGGYMKKKSGRGNQGKLDDKIYSAFVSTLMDQDAEGRERLGEVWKEARERGSQAAFDQQNDGAAKSTLIDFLKQNGGFADRFLESKEFKRILSEAVQVWNNAESFIQRFRKS